MEDQQQVMLVLNHNSNEASVIVQNSSATAANSNSGTNNNFVFVGGRRRCCCFLTSALFVGCLFLCGCFYFRICQRASIIFLYYAELCDRARSRHRGYRVVEISGASLARSLVAFINSVRLVIGIFFCIAVFWKS